MRRFHQLDQLIHSRKKEWLVMKCINASGRAIGGWRDFLNLFSGLIFTHSSQLVSAD